MEKRMVIIGLLILTLLWSVWFWLNYPRKQPEQEQIKIQEIIYPVFNEKIRDNIVRNVLCYNLDGTGPVADCPSKIECYSNPKSNGNYWKIDCPNWKTN